ncbi:MAG: ribonuclease III [Clostridia bacterium]|nr:MAG: ribonuclease III [Clostridia bacterium]
MERQRQQQLLELQQRCGINMPQLPILNTALTHPSYAFENRLDAVESNQRLEFLGDAVLGLVVAEFLYRRFPHRPEGELTRMRAAMVCEPTLARVARKLDLGRYLLLGRGEELSGGRERPSILADVFEAVCGAICLDVGLEAAREFILGQLSSALQELETQRDYGDYKTVLQELVQRKYDENVSYLILDERGPDHRKEFVAGVRFHGRILATGSGRSKKEAEQQAAKKALDNILEREGISK